MTRSALYRVAMRRLAEAFADQLSEDEIHQIVVEEVFRLTDAASVALCLLVEGRTMLDFRAVTGENATEIVGLQIRVEDSLSESAIETKQAYFKDIRPEAKTGSLFPAFNEEQCDPSLNPFSSQQTNPNSFSSFSPYSPKALSAAVTPLFIGDEVIGTLVALNKGRPSASTLPLYPGFDAEDLDILATFAAFSALAIQNKVRFQLANEQERELVVLYDAAKTVASSLNLQKVLDSVLSAVCNHLEYHSATLFLLNDEKTHLFIAAERGLQPSERQVQLSVDFGAHISVLENGVARLISDTEKAEDYHGFSTGEVALSVLIAPVRSREGIHGLLVMDSLQKNAYLESDLKLVDTVAMQAGIAIENAWLYEDAQRKAQEAATLYDLSQHINEVLNLDYVLSHVADSVMNLFNADSFALSLYDEKTSTLVPKVVRDLEAQFLETSLKVGQGIAGWVYEWQTPQAVTDISADARNSSAPLEVYGATSLLCVPMQLGEEAIGVMQVMSRRRRHFTVSEMELLYTIANQTAASAMNAMLYKEAKARTHEMSRYFRRVAHAIGSSLDASALPQLLANLAVAIMRADRCTFYRVEGGNLALEATSGFRASALPDRTIATGQGLTGYVAKRGQSLVLSAVQEDSRASFHPWLKKDRMSSYLAIPLKAGRQTVGVLEILTIEPREFTKEEVQLLSTFARRSKVAESLKLAMANV